MTLFWYALLFVLNALPAPFFAYLAALATAALACRRRSLGDDPPRRRFLVVIPAHDEEGGIAAAVASCRAVDYPAELVNITVIADNCANGTAQAARAAGARVVERRDDLRRGKGYALADFFDDLMRPGAADLPDAVVVVDADTQVDPGLLRWFARDLDAGREWVQCYYTASNPDASWRTRLLTYALGLYNGVWPLGQEVLGLGVGLRGNGMCFATRALARVPWRAHGLAEDQEFSWALRLAGERAHFTPEARVYGEMVSRGGASAASQRRRWEDGRRALRRSVVGPLLASRRIGPLAKVAYLVDLYCPPLVELALGLLAVAAADIAAVAGLHLGPYLLLPPALMALALAIYGLGPFLALGLPWRHLRDLAYLPAYAAWKLAVGARPGPGPGRWIRTGREESVGSGQWAVGSEDRCQMADDREESRTGNESGP
jgi:hypothetical protein